MREKYHGLFAGKQLIIEQEHYTSDPFDELAEGIRFLRNFGSESE